MIMMVRLQSRASAFSYNPGYLQQIIKGLHLLEIILLLHVIFYMHSIYFVWHPETACLHEYTNVLNTEEHLIGTQEDKFQATQLSFTLGIISLFNHSIEMMLLSFEILSMLQICSFFVKFD